MSSRIQIWFNKIIRGFYVQDWEQSFDQDSYRYISDDGHRCPVGWIVSDQVAEKLDTHHNTIHQLRLDKQIQYLGLGNLSEPELCFLEAIQDYHDGFPGELKKRFKELGFMYNLTFPQDVY